MKAFKKIFLFVLVVLTGNVFSQNSQRIQLDAVLDTAKMRIGEQAKIDIYVTYNSREDLKIKWPTIGDTITGKVEVVAVSPIDTTFPDKTNSTKIFQHQQVIVSVYDSGFYAIPGFKFFFNGDTANPQFTNPLFLEVHTVPTDTSATKLKDIKEPFEEKFNWRWYLDYIYWGAGILALIIATILITRYYTKKNQRVVQEPEKPKVPPHITALAALERIKQEQIWREGKVKEYYSSISETVRAYIEGRFNVNALESVTDEIMKAFRSQVVDQESKEKLQQLLTLSDLVKFAKMTPIEEEHNFTLQNAFDFVNGTKREDEMYIAPEEGSGEITTSGDATSAQPSNANPVQAKTQFDAYMPGATTAVPEKKPVQTYSNEKEEELRAARNEKGKKRLRLILLIGIPLVVLLAFGITMLRNAFSSPADSSVSAMVENVNKMCPVMLDADTRMDNVSVTGEKSIQVNYTLVNITAQQIDVNKLKSRLEPGIVQQIKTSPQFEKMRAGLMTIKFSYNDKEGNFLFSIKVGPEEYGNYN